LAGVIAPGVSAAPIVIEPPRGLALIRLADLWAHRELLYFLAWRDLSVRYRQTLLGVGWAVAQPLLTLAVFAVVFGRLARLPSDGLPYASFALAGLLAWQCFATALASASNSLVSGAALITKVYFPRLLLPTAALLPALVDLAVGVLVLSPFLWWQGVRPGPSLAFLPAVALLPALTALAVGLWTSALSVRYRDVRHVMPLLTQLWLFATPVVYPAALVPRPWRLAAALNPMWGPVEAFRACLVGRALPLDLLLVSAASATLLMGAGTLFFRRMERVFADEI
jgi:lipopolysaccharide transport system permease protein